MVESVFVIMLLCLIFWGFLQVALLYNHERILQFASFASARSAAVGFSYETYRRAYRAAAIGASGLNRDLQGMDSRDMPANELVIIPSYVWQNAEMDYQYWVDYRMNPDISPSGQSAGSLSMISEAHSQEHPLEMPMVGAYYRLNRGTNATVWMMGNIKTDIASHYPLYLR